jgi:hypothetical protein
MEFDTDKVDEATLALLYLVMWREHDEHHAWKTFDWNTMARLHDKGLISDPRGKSKSLEMTEVGARDARELFEKMFGISE